MEPDHLSESWRTVSMEQVVRRRVQVLRAEEWRVVVEGERRGTTPLPLKKLAEKMDTMESMTRGAEDPFVVPSSVMKVIRPRDMAILDLISAPIVLSLTRVSRMDLTSLITTSVSSVAPSVTQVRAATVDADPTSSLLLFDRFRHLSIMSTMVTFLVQMRTSISGGN